MTLKNLVKQNNYSTQTPKKAIPWWYRRYRFSRRVPRLSKYFTLYMETSGQFRNTWTAISSSKYRKQHPTRLQSPLIHQKNSIPHVKHTRNTSTEHCSKRSKISRYYLRNLFVYVCVLGNNSADGNRGPAYVRREKRRDVCNAKRVERG